jgi:hypothetical protein
MGSPGILWAETAIHEIICTLFCLCLVMPITPLIRRCHIRLNTTCDKRHSTLIPHPGSYQGQHQHLNE